MVARASGKVGDQLACIDSIAGPETGPRILVAMGYCTCRACLISRTRGTDVTVAPKFKCIHNPSIRFIQVAPGPPLKVSSC